MTNLSPAALAVRDAAERQTDLDFRYAPMIAAAALRAAANQIIEEVSPVEALLAIAAELDGSVTPD